MSALGADAFDWQRHGEYFKRHLQSMPHHYASMDTNRLTLLYFCVSGLDLLGMLGDIDKERVTEFIYFYMSVSPEQGGFYGYPRVAFDDAALDLANNQPHIANTYVALVMLIMLGDDLGRVDRAAVANSLRKWQLLDGSFCCVHGVSSLDSESDIRFVYCAAAICYILDLWHAVDTDKMFSFLSGSQSYDGAFGMGPSCESHGGCTFCSLAALSMMGRLGDLPQKDELVDWCIKRQHFGFQGRVEKALDTCYSFWVGASLDILGARGFIDGGACAAFIKQCEFRQGGFQKFPDVPMPDLLHSYFSCAGLSMCGLLPPMHSALNLSRRAFDSAPAGLFRPAPGGRPWSLPLVPTADADEASPQRPPVAAESSAAADDALSACRASPGLPAWRLAAAAVLLAAAVHLLRSAP